VIEVDFADVEVIEKEMDFKVEIEKEIMIQEDKLMIVLEMIVIVVEMIVKEMILE
jgi:hypothetical protein